MLGLNKRISVIETTRTFSDSGAVVDEAEVVLFSNVPAAIQSHVLNNMPPPPDRKTMAGIFYLREFRCWIPVSAISGTTPKTTWIIQDEATEDKYRVRAVVDDAGRAHHWLLRMENYDG